MKFTVFLSIITFVFVGFVMSSKEQKNHTSEGEQLINSILAKTAEIIKEKYSIKPCGIGVAMPGGPIQEVTLCFDAKKNYTMGQLRELLMNSARELLKQVKIDNKVQKFLKNSSFTISNVEIIIYNHDKSGRGLQDPEISIARISQAKLIYRTRDPQDPLKYKNKFEESFEEACELMNK